MEIGDELARKSEIHHSLISRIIKDGNLEISGHNKACITRYRTLLDKTIAFLIMTRSSFFAAKNSGGREIQKVNIRVELCHICKVSYINQKYITL